MNTKEKNEDKGWKVTGYIDKDDVDLPSEERMKKEPVSVIECPQKIPCDPCKAHCPVDAIKMDDLNEIPKVDYDQCVGCSICAQKCPGLAIFMIEIVEKDKAEVTIPFEFKLPELGEEVEALDRRGEYVCMGEVVNIVSREDSFGNTPLVTIKIPKNYLNTVRGLQRTNNV